jgi:hypothetical protein
MRNFGEMVDETLSYLRSYVRDQEQSTHLTQAIRFDETDFAVAEGGLVTRGRIEIDDELLWVDKADRASGQVSIPPYGRGMDGTVKADHAAGARVIVQPLYPRKVVKDRLNDAIRQIGSKLYGIEELTFVGDPTTFAYELPAYTREVLGVKLGDERGPQFSRDVRWERRWTFDRRAPVAVSATGKALYLRECMLAPTDRLTVVVGRDPAGLLFDVQMFSETFLPASAWDVPVLFAASRMLATGDAYNTLDSKVQAGSAVSYSKYLLGLATTRLDEERGRLLTETVQRTHYSR